jgi:hypothetical protein
MIACRPKIKIYADDVIGTISIEFHGLVLADEFTLVPKNAPSIAPGVGDIETEINHVTLGSKHTPG